MKNLTPLTLYALSDAIEQIKAINEIAWSDTSDQPHSIDAYFSNSENQNKIIDLLSLGDKKSINDYVNQQTKLDSPLGDFCRDLMRDEDYLNAPNAIHILALLTSMMSKPHLSKPIGKIIDDVYASKLNEYFNQG